MSTILTRIIWWPTFGNIDRPLILFSAQSLNTEPIMKGALCRICVCKNLVRFFEKHAQNLNTPQINPASWDLHMGFNLAFKGITCVHNTVINPTKSVTTLQDTLSTGRKWSCYQTSAHIPVVLIESSHVSTQSLHVKVRTVSQVAFHSCTFPNHLNVWHYIAWATGSSTALIISGDKYQ